MPAGSLWWRMPPGKKKNSMRFLQAVIGIIAVAVLIWLAFIIGTFLLKVFLGLAAIAVIIWLVWTLVRKTSG